ncbi:MAG: transglutaminase family protein [Leptolyngbyaceae cyanobacterium bins.349]|nr:transglutaminase family protein [Leptolyngbyaceae cyanobacterium bins.349]
MVQLTMAIVYELVHTTTYRYANPVTLGEHRAMFLPRGSYAGRILNYSVETNVPSSIHWISDTLSNNVAILQFSEPTTNLIVTCQVRGEHFGVKGIEAFPLEPRAELVPVQYTPDEWIDLSVYLRPHAEDPDGRVAAWAKHFVAGDQDETQDVLKRMMDEIRDTFTYKARDDEGTQLPGDTLFTRSGTCRDYAWLMIEALRRLGFACRFISGYLYDAALDGGDVGMTGSGATHAWLQVYLPGAGWLVYDPTNRITAGFDLIQVAIARHPGQAMPLAGSWFGDAKDYLGMEVNVTVRKLREFAAHN